MVFVITIQYIINVPAPQTPDGFLLNHVLHYTCFAQNCCTTSILIQVINTVTCIVLLLLLLLFLLLFFLLRKQNDINLVYTIYHICIYLGGKSFEPDLQAEADNNGNVIVDNL